MHCFARCARACLEHVAQPYPYRDGRSGLPVQLQRHGHVRRGRMRVPSRLDGNWLRGDDPVSERLPSQRCAEKFSGRASQDACPLTVIAHLVWQASASTARARAMMATRAPIAPLKSARTIALATACATMAFASAPPTSLAPRAIFRGARRAARHRSASPRAPTGSVRATLASAASHARHARAPPTAMSTASATKRRARACATTAGLACIARRRGARVTATAVACASTADASACPVSRGPTAASSIAHALAALAI